MAVFVAKPLSDLTDGGTSCLTKTLTVRTNGVSTQTDGSFSPIVPIRPGGCSEVDYDGQGEIIGKP